MIDNVYSLAGLVLILATVIWMTIYINHNYLQPKNIIREAELKNDTYNLFSQVSVEAVNSYLEEYFTDYIKRYITINFFIRKINYIKEEDCELLVKNVTGLIFLEISDLYIFYIKMVYSIKDENQLLKYINTKVRYLAVEQITAYNTSQI